MTGKGVGGKKSKYMYYTCEKCKIYFNEDDVEGTLMDYILDFIEYDYHVNKFFYHLLAEKKDDESKEIEKEISKLNAQKDRIKTALETKRIKLHRLKGRILQPYSFNSQKRY